MSLTELQRQCFQNFLSDYPLVIRSLYGSSYQPHEVCERAMELADMMETGDLPDTVEMCDLTKAIFKASIERNDWLEPYEGQSDASRARRPEEMQALRECAAILEGYGIEIDFIPS
ncbi:hypothetical protein vBCbaSRXM_61 [Citromicrobium phage vB_CbaS-RXM]|nr:hypothetical protein vBCbaSRXM_61 [Citromicrobium phage vB_CbaS-RXM]